MQANMPTPEELEKGIRLGTKLAFKAVSELVLAAQAEEPDHRLQLLAIAVAFGSFQLKLEAMRAINADFAGLCDMMQELAREFITMKQHQQFTGD